MGAGPSRFKSALRNRSRRHGPTTTLHLPSPHPISHHTPPSTIPGGRQKEWVSGSPPKKRLCDRQCETNRLVELRLITTRPTHTKWVGITQGPCLHQVGTNERAVRPILVWGSPSEFGAERRPRHRKTRLRRPRRLEGGGARKRSSAPRQRRGRELEAPTQGGQNVFFSFLFFFFVFLFSVEWGEGETPLGRHGSSRVAVGDARTGIGLGKK